MRIGILITSFLLTLITISSCDSSPNGPENPSPGRRDYMWTAETLNTPTGLDLTRMWGSSEKDVWAFGGGASLNQI